MSDNAKPNGFVWDQIEKFINDKLSFMNPVGKTAAEGFLQKQPEWVERLVGQVLEQALPGTSKTTGTKPAGTKSGGAKQGSSVSTELFETHRYVIAKIKLPSGEHPKSLQVLVRSDRIKLVGLAAGSPHYIPLPAPVLARTARAEYREGVLQVQARKRKKGPYHEAYIE